MDEHADERYETGGEVECPKRYANTIQAMQYVCNIEKDIKMIIY